MYVLIEGIDTAGKSTQLDILKQKYPNAVFTKEPGGTELGIKLREMVLNGEANSKLAEMFLFLADRAEHNEEIIKKNGKNLIISDRGFLSGIAYAKTLPIEKAIALNTLALNGNMPDKVIILKLSKDELEHRLSQKEHDTIESRGSKYLLEIQSRMIEALNLYNTLSENSISYIIIDASKSIKEISYEIQNFIEN